MSNKPSKEMMELLEEKRRKGNDIYAFFHCSKCIDEDEYPNIGVGWTTLGLQVWCEHHNKNIIHLDFCGQKVEVV